MLIAGSDGNTQRLEEWNKHLEPLISPDYCHFWWGLFKTCMLRYFEDGTKEMFFSQAQDSHT